MGANRTGSMRPSPPLEMGRQLCDQERGVSVVRRHFWSEDAKRFAHWVGKSNRRGGGRARSRWVILGVERECRRRVRAACGWFRLGSVSSSGESLVRVEVRNDITAWGEARGRPSRVVPSSQVEKGMWCKWSGRDKGVVGEVRIHLPALTLRSVGWSWSRRCWKAWETSLGGPKIFPSSRYQEWKEWGAMEGREEMMGCIPRAKRMGESGSPC